MCCLIVLGPKVSLGSSRCQQGWILPEALRENLFPSLFSFYGLRAFLDSWPLPCFTPPSCLAFLLLLTLIPLAPSDKDPYDDIGPTWVIQDSLLISVSFMSAESFLPREDTYSQVPGDRTCTCLEAGAFFCPPIPGQDFTLSTTVLPPSCPPPCLRF